MEPTLHRSNSTVGTLLSRHMSTKEDDNLSDAKRYVKVNPAEHALTRSDMYIGSSEKQNIETWVLKGNIENMTKVSTKVELKKKEIKYAPGLYKIIDEIFTNATDRESEDKTMNRIDVTISDDGMIKVRNNGVGLPAKIHEKENVYILELVFGNLMTSSHYNDNEKRTTGGKYGLGAKLTIIFSKYFKVSSVGYDEKKDKYLMSMEFEDNMKKRSKISKKKFKGEMYTEIEFMPEYERFGFKSGLTSDFRSLLYRRVFDIAGWTGKKITVTLNDNKIPINDFKEYSQLYTQLRDSVFYSNKSRKYDWDIIVSLSKSEDFEHVSMVNGLVTSRGGEHVDYIANKIVSHLSDVYQKKLKSKTKIPPRDIKRFLFVMVKATIPNPEFDGQVKEYLITKPSKFKEDVEIDLPSSFLKKVEKLEGLYEAVEEVSNVKIDKSLAKQSGKQKNRISGIPKLHDANKAGTSQSHKCTLAIVEGDSALSLVLSGRQVAGSDYLGAYPLKGKPLNVRNTSMDKIQKNKEFMELVKIIGLPLGKKDTVKSIDSLRYGRLLFLTDQDLDGSHIKGLLMNMFHYFRPELFDFKGFMVSLATPIVKVTKGKVSRSFYTLPEFEKWSDEVDDISKWRIKYYKGLGTSTAKEAREYFTNYEDKLQIYHGNVNNSFEKWFGKDSEPRKKALLKYEHDEIIEQTEKNVGVKDFFNKDFIHFSNYDTQRSIPSAIDGMKPSQRKVLYGMFKKQPSETSCNELKVAQVSGYIAENSAYHHGEASLMGTIIGMAQRYVGSNNIALLEPRGQFGTRLMGGKDSASPRYIFTCLDKLAYKIFNPLDTPILNHQTEEQMDIEPEFYVPILPMILINGSKGIGTGWNTETPCYNPRDIIRNIKDTIEGDKPKKLKPWYRGFEGKIETSRDSFETVGKYKFNDSKRSVHVTELPIGVWTQKYRETLDEMLVNKKWISRYDSNISDVSVDFTIVFNANDYSKFSEDRELFEKTFKMRSKMSMKKMNLYGENFRLEHYKDANDIIEYYSLIRLETYAKRKKYLLKIWNREKAILDGKIRFIKKKIFIDIMFKKDDEVEKILKSKKFIKFVTKRDITKDLVKHLDEKIDFNRNENGGDYNYLTDMPFRSLTDSVISKMEERQKKLNNNINELDKMSPKKMWIKELDEFEEEYDKWEKKLEEN